MAAELAPRLPFMSTPPVATAGEEPGMFPTPRTAPRTDVRISRPSPPRHSTRQAARSGIRVRERTSGRHRDRRGGAGRRHRRGRRVNPPVGVADCRVIGLPHHDDARGSVTILERASEIPFEVRRAFLITNVPPGATRGEHANMRASQLIVCASGALTVRVEDDMSARSIPISSHAGAVLVPPTLWMELRDFAPGTVVVVLADTDYRESSRVRDRAEWLRARELYCVA